MTKEQFKQDILKGIEALPPEWRYGQKVFNLLDRIGIARTVQPYVDCFYRDDLVDQFIDKAYEIINSQVSSNP